MMHQKFTLNDLAEILSTKAVVHVDNTYVKQVLYDSRKLIKPNDTVFFAIKTQRNDGHRYIQGLIDRGVKNFVVSEVSETLKSSQVNYIHVSDTLKALQTWAAWHRSNFQGQVVAITGSNGKTIVKEWLHHLLSGRQRVFKSPSSFNSQLGVPLSVMQVTAKHKLAIIEAGISKPGEMQNLENIIKPDVGIFTHLGSAHGANFTNDTEKLHEKLKLFENSKALIYCKDEPLLSSELEKHFQSTGVKLLSWSENSEAWLQVKASKGAAGFTHISATTAEGVSAEIDIPFADKASLQNAIHCLAFCVYSGVDTRLLWALFKTLSAVNMRLEQKAALYNSTIVNDSYSSDPDSLSNALNYLATQQQHRRKVLVISDMLESSLTPDKLYQTTANLLNATNADLIIAIGPEMLNHSDKFKGNVRYYPTTREFLDEVSPEDFADAAILVKGARVFHFEDIVAHFEVQKHGTVLEIHLNAVAHNLQYYRSLIPAACKTMCMVKALAYGSGAAEVAMFLQQQGVDYLAVAYADEGVALRRAGIKLPIMVMNSEASSFDNIIRYRLEPELYSREIFESFQKVLEDEHIDNYPVHIKFDTGMHRLGWDENQVDELTNLLKLSRMQVMSVFSHLAASEADEHKIFTQNQIADFDRISSTLKARLGYTFMRHIANSAALSRFPQSHFDMVRLGIGLYGVSNNAAEQDKLNEVVVLKTIVSQVKRLNFGDSIGYGRAAKAEKETDIATIAIGYADGFGRSLSIGKGHVLVKGRKVPVVGNVCMDMTMIDVTDMKVQCGDDVIVFGQGISIHEFAKNLGTIPYEALTGISSRVKRVYYYA